MEDNMSNQMYLVEAILTHAGMFYANSIFVSRSFMFVYPGKNETANEKKVGKPARIL